MSRLTNSRAAAALVIYDVVFRHRKLDRALDRTLIEWAAEDRGLIAEIAYGVVRWFGLLEHILNRALDRPMRTKDQDLMCLLCVGLYQLKFMRIPAYASVSETVNATKELGKPWARGLANAVLRKCAGNEKISESNAMTEACYYAHPQWMVDLIKQEWPNCWQNILNANNSKPKVTLRVDVNRTSVDAYLEALATVNVSAEIDQCSPVGLQLEERIGVDKLPGFEQGMVSVQSAASQMAALSMDLAPGQRVLDACSAPGGKLLHIMEIEPKLDEVVAIDIDQARTQKIVDNLARADKNAQIITADASRPSDWWDGKPFDRILVDSPCSAFGVISKHPDIKHHRRPDDIDRVVEQQNQLLSELLPLLNKNGKLLYTTCSILSRENDGQIDSILRRFPDYAIDRLPAALGQPTQFGYQRLPDESGGDGFYYARLSQR